MMKLVSIGISSLLIVQIALCDDVIHLNSGQAAPFEGWLFSPAKEQQLRLTNDTLTYYTNLNTTLTTINQLQDTEIKVCTDRISIKDQQITSLDKRLADAGTGFWSNLGFFILGAAATTLLTFGVRQATK